MSFPASELRGKTKKKLRWRDLQFISIPCRSCEREAIEKNKTKNASSDISSVCSSKAESPIGADAVPFVRRARTAQSHCSCSACSREGRRLNRWPQLTAGQEQLKTNRRACRTDWIHTDIRGTYRQKRFASCNIWPAVERRGKGNKTKPARRSSE